MSNMLSVASAARFSWAKRARRSSRGFSLVEVSIVTAIVLLLAIVGIPAINGFVIENKVPKVSEELSRFILQTTVNATQGAAAPYSEVDTGHFASLVRDSAIFSISGSGPQTRVQHGLGGGGEVVVTPVEGGKGFSIALDKVNHAACPSLTSVMQRVASVMTLAAGGQRAITVKSDTVPYSALAVQSRCGKGDVNTFVFTVNS